MQKALSGTRKVLMFKLAKDRDKKNATRLALETTHTIKEAGKVATTETKDGTVNNPGEITTTIDIEALASDSPIYRLLHYAAKHSELVDCWEINFDKPSPDSKGKYLAQYGSGYLSSWETPDKVGDNETIKTTLNVDGKLVSGYATVSDEDVATANNFFRDTTASATEEKGLDEYSQIYPEDTNKPASNN